MRGRIGFGLWCSGLGLALWVLHSLGSTQLGTPPLPWRWSEWIDTVGPAVGVVAVVRLVAMVCGWYLAAVSIVGALGRRAGTPRFVTAIDRATPAFLRVLLASAGGLTLSAVGLTMAVTPLLAPADKVSTASLRAVALPPSSAGVPLREQREQPGPGPSATLRPLDFRLGPLAVPNLSQGQGPRSEQWVVRTGDHFWAMATETLADAWGRQPTEGEVSGYWASLIEVNRSNLTVAANPDLIYPGQVMVLPPVGGDQGAGA